MESTTAFLSTLPIKVIVGSTVDPEGIPRGRVQKSIQSFRVNQTIDDEQLLKAYSDQGLLLSTLDDIVARVEQPVTHGNHMIATIYRENDGRIICIRSMRWEPQGYNILNIDWLGSYHRWYDRKYKNEWNPGEDTWQFLGAPQ